MNRKIKRVAVIGGGPSGLSMLKALRGEEAFDYIKCFERGPYTGGIWNYSETPSTSTIPSTDPHTEPQGWESPIYNDLDGNIVRETQTWNEYPLGDKTTPLFMDRTQLLNYIKDYGKSVESIINFNTKITRLDQNAQGKWNLYYRTSSGENSNEEFDAVAVTTGNYNLPYLPDYPHIRQFSDKHPSVIIHSKTYRHPENYKNKSVLVVGGTVSAYDLARQIGDKTPTKLYQSLRSGEPSSLLKHPNTVFFPEISSFDPETRGIIFKDGQKINELDSVIFATGYLRSYPFLDDSINKSNMPIITDGKRLNNVYKHLFYIANPSLVFLATPRFIAPFQTAEAQAAYVAKVWSEKSQPLPSFEDQKNWELNRIKTHGDGTGFDSIPYPENVDYQKFLEDQVSLSTSSPNSTCPKHIDDTVYTLRKNVAQLKLANNKYIERHDRKPYRIQQLIDDGLFEWK